MIQHSATSSITPSCCMQNPNCKEEAAEKFKRISEAYDVLTDPEVPGEGACVAGGQQGSSERGEGQSLDQLGVCGHVAQTMYRMKRGASQLKGLSAGP